MHTQRIVVGYDGSAEARKAARWALDEAERSDVPVELVYAYEWPTYVPAAAMMPAAAVYPDVDTDLAVAEMLGRAVDTAMSSHPGVRVWARVEHSTAAVALLQRAADASLVVLGGRRPTGMRAWLGSTSGSVSAHARCPVVVVRGEPRATDPVVAGVDESEAAGLVLGFAFEQAAVRGVPVRAVHGWSPPDGRDLLCETNLRAIGEERGRLEALVGCWRRRYPGIPVSAEVMVGSPGEVLAQAAAGAQLVVAGARTRRALRAVLRPSVGRHLLHRARCSVALVSRTRAAIRF
ncbi:nucleotide-binding universal stress UspA family protein [Actinoplanes octamycinicus]|uniref:Nucleotide-binding universal stress UspA family protein n=1 Tax=Actinoplanes octamycinicus TaxID=135948 RepID=A0A7W7GYD4_9ACTN|nr:universal stress protein [Actinoplanes octamycinicus]MBB4740591.1 nucleotide-binding universal stress UspA family protein [Actinoplanes octamycinicus]GIE63108.1 universal stress protein [Actinoplanes octamycinicus]